MFREFSKLQVHRLQNHQGIQEGDQGFLMLLMDTTQLTTSHHCRPMQWVGNAYYSLHIILNIEKMRTEWTLNTGWIFTTKYFLEQSQIYLQVWAGQVLCGQHPHQTFHWSADQVTMYFFWLNPLSLSQGQYISRLYWKVSLCRNILGNSRISDHFCNRLLTVVQIRGIFPNLDHCEKSAPLF